MSRRNQSGSPSAWKARRLDYQKRSGPCSNPTGNRKALRLAYFTAWDEAVEEEDGREEYRIDQFHEAQDVRAEMFPEEG